MRISLISITILALLLANQARCFAQEAPATQTEKTESDNVGDGSKSSEDEAMKPPLYRLALEQVVLATLHFSTKLGAIESTDAEREEGLKRIPKIEHLLQQLPDHAKAIQQLRNADRAWADARIGPVKSRQINLLDMDEQDAIAELELLETSMRICLKQMARSGKQAADRELDPEDRLAAALDVQQWSQKLAVLYASFWVNYAPGMFLYGAGIEKAVERDVYRGGFKTDYCKLKQDVFESKGGGVSSKLVPPADHEKEEQNREKLLKAGIPPTIEAYKKHPESWPGIGRVVPAGTALEIRVMVWRNRVTNAYLDVYAIPIGKEEPKQQRLLNIGDLCNWKDYPYTRNPKPEYLTIGEL